VIYSKSINYRRDIKRGRMSADAKTDEMLAKYKSKGER